MTALHVGPPPPFVAHLASDERRALVRLIGELDLAAAPQAQQAIELAERKQPATLELDLSSLAFMDSTGLRLLLSTRQRAREAGRQLVLRRGPQAVHRVFEVTALAPLFEFVD
jgi:anti-sigma B factor antagonist